MGLPNSRVVAKLASKSAWFGTCHKLDHEKRPPVDRDEPIAGTLIDVGDGFSKLVAAGVARMTVSIWGTRAATKSVSISLISLLSLTLLVHFLSGIFSILEIVVVLKKSSRSCRVDVRRGRRGRH